MHFLDGKLVSLRWQNLTIYKIIWSQDIMEWMKKARFQVSDLKKGKVGREKENRDEELTDLFMCHLEQWFRGDYFPPKTLWILKPMYCPFAEAAWLSWTPGLLLSGWAYGFNWVQVPSVLVFLSSVSSGLSCFWCPHVCAIIELMGFCYENFLRNAM